MEFIKHDKLVNQTGEPNRDIIAYNARRWQINQIGCQADITGKLSLEAVSYRLACLMAGVAIPQPHWSSLITWKE